MQINPSISISLVSETGASKNDFCIWPPYIERMDKGTGRILFLSIAVPLAISVIIAFLLYSISGAQFLRSLGISAVYAISCGILAVFPTSLLLDIKSRIPGAILIILAVFLTAGATVMSEYLLSLLIYEAPFTIFGEYHMLWVNLILVGLTILIIFQVFPAKKEENIMISFRTSDGIKILDTAVIDYLKAESKFVFIHTAEGQILADKTLTAFEGELPPNFLRISRSCIINRDRIFQVQKDKEGTIMFRLHTTEGATLKAGVTYIPRLKKIFSFES